MPISFLLIFSAVKFDRKPKWKKKYSWCLSLNINFFNNFSSTVECYLRAHGYSFSPRVIRIMHCHENMIFFPLFHSSFNFTQNSAPHHILELLQWWCNEFFAAMELLWFGIYLHFYAYRVIKTYKTDLHQSRFASSWIKFKKRKN